MFHIASLPPSLPLSLPLSLQIKKAYGDNEQSVTAREEVQEMREHVMGETDTDRDGTISLDEWMKYTGKDIFNVNEEWKPIPERPHEDVFTENVRKIHSHLYILGDSVGFSIMIIMEGFLSTLNVKLRDFFAHVWNDARYLQVKCVRHKSFHPLR